jgi:hypothetical protein
VITPDDEELTLVFGRENPDKGPCSVVIGFSAVAAVQDWMVRENRPP